MKTNGMLAPSWADPIFAERNIDGVISTDEALQRLHMKNAAKCKWTKPRPIEIFEFRIVLLILLPVINAPFYFGSYYFRRMLRPSIRQSVLCCEDASDILYVTYIRGRIKQCF